MHLRFLQTDTPADSRPNWISNATRALALFFGGFALLNVAGDMRVAGFDANLWWIDLRVLPPTVSKFFLLLSSICLIAFAIRPPQSAWRQIATKGIVALLAAAVFWNVLEFYALVARHDLQVLLPLPLSLLILSALTIILMANAGERPRLGSSIKTFWRVGALFLLCIGIFPIAQMICFGKNDYRRAADVAVVFGARAYKDGHPSDALADRVKTACQLYRDGLVKKLIFSGGPGDGDFSESAAMRRLAIDLGVKPTDILTDDLGLNTQATVKNSEALFTQLHAKKVLVVSHFYHLPRVKLAYQRTGWEVYTVPAKETRVLGMLPYFVAREVAAMWVYYLRPLAA